ncbi:MAG: QueT transporter family protein [Sporolactobacillus sp.]
MKKLKLILLNAFIAAVYIVLTYISQPVAFYAIQFRISEILNHLVVFDKRYFFGIIGGVFLANLFFSPMLPFDLTFGLGQSILSLAITLILIRYVKNVWARMLINTFVFTVSMAIISWELSAAGVAGHVPFWMNWLTIAAGEFTVMIIGMPIIYAVQKRVHFDKQF